MTEEKKGEGQARSSSGGAAGGADAEQQTGDPGRTPGTAEGDRKTVEEDLESKQGSQK